MRPGMKIRARRGCDLEALLRKWLSVHIEREEARYESSEDGGPLFSATDWELAVKEILAAPEGAIFKSRGYGSWVSSTRGFEITRMGTLGTGIASSGHGVWADSEWTDDFTPVDDRGLRAHLARFSDDLPPSINPEAKAIAALNNRKFLKKLIRAMRHSYFAA